MKPDKYVNGCPTCGAKPILVCDEENSIWIISCCTHFLEHRIREEALRRWNRLARNLAPLVGG